MVKPALVPIIVPNHGPRRPNGAPISFIPPVFGIVCSAKAADAGLLEHPWAPISRGKGNAVYMDTRVVDARESLPSRI